MPVNSGSSQLPSGRWVRTSQSTPRVTAADRSPAASSASSAQAVCEAVEVPRPIQPGSRYERRSSPQPPSGFCTRSSQRTARRIGATPGATPAATSAGSTAPVPYR